MKLSVRTPGGHSAYPHVSKSANRIAAALIRDLESLESIVPATPHPDEPRHCSGRLRQPAEATVPGGGSE